MRLKLFILILSMFSLGCGKAVTNFVGNTGIGRSPDSATPTPQISGSTVLKISPGEVMSSAGTVSMRATITSTRMIETGSGISAQLSINSQAVK